MNTTCQHDPMYRIENEANGGIGCPICRLNRKRVVMVQHADGRVEIDDTPRPGYIVNPAAQMSEAQAVADEKMAEYATWQENAKDWNDIKGDCAL